MKTSPYKIATILLLIIGICYYNIITMENQKVINQKIDITKNKIKLFQKNNDSSSDLINQYNRYMKSIPTLATYYENDNVWTFSASYKIRDICNKYNVDLVELNPKLNNTLDVSQNAIENLAIEIERYSIDLSIRGSFLNIGLLINELSDMNYLINSMDIKSTINKKQVEASIDLFFYRSRQNQNAYDNSINIEKIKNGIPIIPNETLSNQIKWKNNIFLESRLTNNRDGFKNQVSFQKEYVLSQIVLSKPLGAIINNKLYSIGAKIGPYVISKIDEHSVVLSGKRKSLVLEVEVDEDQSVYSLDGFKKAFSSARKNNQNTFIYKGKLYSTRLNN